MSYNVIHLIKAEEFRQNYTPELQIDGASRHWMLDFAAGRDLLKAKLRKYDPTVSVPIWKEGREVDGKLNQMIDELALRDMPEPVGRIEQLKATAKFFRLMVLC